MRGINREKYEKSRLSAASNDGKIGMQNEKRLPG